MTERPILFSGAMVRALLAGRKTQTRRVVKGSPVRVTPFIGRDDKPTNEFGLHFTHEHVINEHVRCPYGAPGDRLWVRETWGAHWMYDDVPPSEARSSREDLRPTDNRWYRADGTDAPSNLGLPSRGYMQKWRPSIHMPRWASRLTLEVTGVRVERLQEITPTDAIAEGIERGPEPRPSSGISAGWRDYLTGKGTSGPVSSFRSLWESINGADSWASNPWVWCVEFKQVTP